MQLEPNSNQNPMGPDEKAIVQQCFLPDLLARTTANHLNDLKQYELIMGRLKEVSINSVGSPHSKRAYQTAIEEFTVWILEKEQITLIASTLLEYKSHLEKRKNAKGDPLSPATISQKMTAVRSLVHSAAACGWIRDELEQSILKHAHNRPIRGVRQGHRMPLDDVRRLLRLPDRCTLRGKRDYAILGVTFAAGLRREEARDLRVSNVGRIDDGWALIDIRGKRNKIRSVPIEDPIKEGIDDWLLAAGISEGRIFRSIRKGGHRCGSSLSGQAIRDIVKSYAAQIGYLDFAPHDARRSCARIYYDNGAQLTQIQMLLGHDNLGTTQKYIGADQKFGGNSVTKAADIS